MTDSTTPQDAKAMPPASTGSLACVMPCRACIERYDLRNPQRPFFRLDYTRMILCEHCGNKRCPHASNHRLACTGSNSSGQIGSAY